jgi:protein gp37
MSDLFHVDVPKAYVHEVFDAMLAAHWHQLQVLTKRSGRLLKLSNELPWPGNIWMGVSLENADYVRRIDHLRSTAAQVKFLSLEPLIGPLPNLDLRNIDWVIVGGESGPGARSMDPGWVREIRDQCIDADVAFFFKQRGACSRSTLAANSTNGRGINIQRWDRCNLQ